MLFYCEMLSLIFSSLFKYLFLEICLFGFDFVVSDMAGANTWIEYVYSQELQNLLGVFNVEVPHDPSKLSFAKGFLEASKLIEFVAEIRSLASGVVLCKRLKDEDKKAGTVYVYEVVVKSIENRIVIEEKVISTNLFIKLVLRNTIMSIIIGILHHCIK